MNIEARKLKLMTQMIFVLKLFFTLNKTNGHVVVLFLKG